MSKTGWRYAVARLWIEAWADDWLSKTMLFIVWGMMAAMVGALAVTAQHDRWADSLEQQAKRSHDAAMQNGHDAMECELKRLDLALDLLACTAECPDWVPLERPKSDPTSSPIGL